MSKLTRLLSGTAPVLFGFLLTLGGCSSPSDTTPQPVDSGIAPETMTGDTGTDSVAVETGNDVSIDSKLLCEEKQACPTEGATCGSLQCIGGTWQNVKADSGTDSGSPDTFDALETSVPDSGTDTADSTPPPPDSSAEADTFDSGTPETIVDSGSPDSGTPDSGTPDSGSGDTDSGTPTDSGPPKTLTCKPSERIVPFDSVTVGCTTCSVEQVGHGWSAGKDSDYLPVRNGGKADVVHWNGTAVTNELIPGLNWAGGMSGTGEGNIWLAGNDTTGAASLRHKTSGVWVLDSTQPSAKRFNDITVASATEMYLLGNDPSWIATVWKGNGSAWTALPKLPSSDWFSPVQLYADGSGRVAVGGYDVDSTTGLPQRVAVYAYDGTSWTKILSPTTENFVISGGIHGTSMNELWFGGATSASQGKLCKLNSLSTWTCYTSSGTTTVNLFGPVYSPWTGAAVVGGGIFPGTLGGARLMTVDLLTSSPKANSIDSKAVSVDTLWREPGTSTYFFAHGGSTSQPAGLYRFTCD